ncbi:dethiobiotin synthase [Ktedonosporobacter rubrisoli]|uniref:ATP-dependent dethiobiotin synthetase BioD n=1 Tax=Ktedonosporobacter rubrisoli TaxID=2509675 RepID=A0A4P6JJD8_KTERU|nr:dethiobiotin synthase [Ktedonosporobacter rubrisoli]QBD75224.1 dethiobiotin synthase [Ktedonosporobacter rubrisoli]
MSKGIFITGTDTGVGKTMLTAVLAVTLRAQGLRVGVMKPAEAGCEEHNGELYAQDAHLLQTMSGCQAPLELIVPYRLREPLAPALAAEHEGVQVDLRHIAACYSRLASAHDVVLIEGAGGLMVPLTENESYLDLAALLDVPILIAARNILGTINHTALTAIVAAQRCSVLGIVLNELDAQQRDLSQASNGESLRRWGRAPLLGTLAYTPELTPMALLHLGLELDLTPILQHLGR